MELRSFYDITPAEEAKLSTKYKYVKQLLTFSLNFNDRLRQVAGSQAANVTALHELSTTINQFNQASDEQNADETALTKHTLQTLKQNVDDHLKKAAEKEAALSSVLQNYQGSDREDWNKFKNLMDVYQQKRLISLEMLDKHQKQSFDDLQNMASTLQLLEDYSQARQQEFYSGVALFNQLQIYEQKYRPRVILPLVGVLQAVEEKSKVDSEEASSCELLDGIQAGAEKAMGEAKDFEVAHSAQSGEALDDSGSFGSGVSKEHQRGWLWVLEERKIDNTPNWLGKALPKNWKRHFCQIADSCLSKTEFIGSEISNENLLSVYDISKINKVIGGKRAFCLELIKQDNSILQVQAESEDAMDTWIELLTSAGGSNVEESPRGDLSDRRGSNDLFTQIGANLTTKAQQAEDVLTDELQKAQTGFTNMFSKITANMKNNEVFTKSPAQSSTNSFNHITATHEFKNLNIIGQSEKFEITEQELSQAPKSLEVIVDREAIAVKSLQSSLSQNSGYVSCKFSENYLLFSNGLKFEWEGIIYSCETEPKSCGFIFKDDDSFSMLLLSFEAEPEFFKMMQGIRVKSQK